MDTCPPAHWPVKKVAIPHQVERIPRKQQQVGNPSTHAHLRPYQDLPSHPSPQAYKGDGHLLTIIIHCTHLFMSDNSINASVESPILSREGSPILPLIPSKSPAPLPVQLRVATPYPTPEPTESQTGAAIYAALQTVTSTPQTEPLLNPARMLDNANYQGPPLSPQTALDLLGGNPSENTSTLLVNIICCLTEMIKK